MPLIDTQAVEIADLAGLQLYELADLPMTSSAPVGVVLTPETKLDAIMSRLLELAVIVIEFPKFRDGRGFTLARTLRQHGYEGDLRAVGHFLPDQFVFLRDCGFNSFVTPPEHTPAQFAAVLIKPHQPGQLLRRSLSRALETTIE